MRPYWRLEMKRNMQKLPQYKGSQFLNSNLFSVLNYELKEFLPIILARCRFMLLPRSLTLNNIVNTIVEVSLQKNGT